MWPFKARAKKIIIPDLEDIKYYALTCPPQQLAARKCVCIRCEKRGMCYTEKLIASNGNCENTWISACSCLTKNKENAIFNAMFGEYYERFK